MSRCDVPKTTLDHLARLAGSASGVTNGQVTGVADDSRDVAPGDVFLCFRGTNHDGHDSAAAAVAAGAAGVVVDHPVAGVRSDLQVVVPDVRAAAGPLTSALLGHPSRQVRMIGVTGTNGKTSTVSFIASLLQANGRTPAVIGTVTGARTTPEAVELQCLLAGAVTQGCTHVVMEVSSHSLVTGRVDGIVFDVAVFTNLGRDHLDFHGSVDDYFAAKARLFGADRCVRAVVNADDAHGRILAARNGVPVESCSRSDASSVRVTAGSVAFDWRGEHIAAGVGGDFTVDNLLLALTVAAGEGIGARELAASCGAVGRVPGRFETVETDGAWHIVVDYAHTPDALERLLSSARDLATGRVIVVFGCGGNRDRGKRPEMGAVASRLADEVIVTSDNPRDEEPGAIIADVLAGVVPGGAKVTSFVDRAEAIGNAVLGALDGDIVVIAGKGHETYQEAAGSVRNFSDQECARAWVGERKGTS
jgi:UDP-N-acetylmuramoyl-L-alanyl-D-glutamate--2,6-diaminopimelate ligase